MPLDIGEAIGEGFRRTTARNGIVLLGIVYVLGVLSGLFGPRTPDDPAGGLPGGTDVPMTAVPDPVIPVSPVVAAVVGFVFTVLSVVVAIGALRIFLTDETRRVPTGAFTRRFAWAFLNLVVGGVVFAVAVLVGFALFFIPGVFLLTVLAYWPVYVVDEDESFVGGFRRSWRLTDGRRLRLFLLGFVVVLLVLLVNVVFAVAGALVTTVSALLGIVVGQIGGAFTTVFVWATLAAAYRQLVDVADDADVAEGLAV